MLHRTNSPHRCPVQGVRYAPLCAPQDLPSVLPMSTVLCRRAPSSNISRTTHDLLMDGTPHAFPKTGLGAFRIREEDVHLFAPSRTLYEASDQSDDVVLIHEVAGASRAGSASLPHRCLFQSSTPTYRNAGVVVVSHPPRLSWSRGSLQDDRARPCHLPTRPPPWQKSCPGLRRWCDGRRRGTGGSAG